MIEMRATIFAAEVANVGRVVELIRLDLVKNFFEKITS